MYLLLCQSILRSESKNHFKHFEKHIIWEIILLLLSKQYNAYSIKQVIQLKLNCLLDCLPSTMSSKDIKSWHKHSDNLLGSKAATNYSILRRKCSVLAHQCAPSFRHELREVLLWALVQRIAPHYHGQSDLLSLR